MRCIFFSLLFPLSLTSVFGYAQSGDYQSPSSRNQNLSSEKTTERFYTTARRLVQQQINLMARIEQALVEPDINPMRGVRGQLTIHIKSVEAFLFRQYQSPTTLCNPKSDNADQVSLLREQLTESQVKIYCSLYTSSQELLKLSPILDQLLSRRGELALVRPLPLVSGERQLDPVLTIAPVQRPHLEQLATPFSSWEPNLSPASTPIIGRNGKTAIANYLPPLQPAIAPPPAALTLIAAAKKFLTSGQRAFPPATEFTNPQANSAIIDRLAYDIDSQEPQTYAKFLQLPHTGIFRVLPYLAYHRQPNTLRNRLQPNVSQRYPFPALSDQKGGFTPSLALQLFGDRIGLEHQGVNYSFLVDLGDVPLEKLDGKLETVVSPTREFFLNYQSPQQLDSLQVERRRFITGKDQNWNLNQVILDNAPAELNHTYLMRSLQFQLPEEIFSHQPVLPTQNQDFHQLQELHSSDIMLAFRLVRRRADGSYTVLWRVLRHFQDPQIEDLQEYLK